MRGQAQKDISRGSPQNNKRKVPLTFVFQSIFNQSSMRPIRMVDLQKQHQAIQDELDQALEQVFAQTAFIKGPAVARFEEELAQYQQCKHAIGCANGTDALQLALMALDLAPGAEVLLPSFTFVATAEVVRLLGLKPVFVDIYADTFNIDVAKAEAMITEDTRVIVPVHLFGQCADMESVMALAKKHNLFVIEDAAQALGATYTFTDGSEKKAGTMGHFGCTSFFPSKNLGAAGDGGAVFTNDDQMGHVVRQLANHGMSTQYQYDRAGINSRLDGLQAALLRVKLPYLDQYNQRRRNAAEAYDNALAPLPQVMCPKRCAKTYHIFHQYTLMVPEAQREDLQKHLEAAGIPSKVYYPTPLQAHRCYANARTSDMRYTEQACRSVLSLPMHTELDEAQLNHITSQFAAFFESAPIPQ